MITVFTVNLRSAQIGDGQAFKERTVPSASWSVDAPALLIELEDERENLFAWFKAAPARISPDMIELVNQVLANQQIDLTNVSNLSKLLRR